MRNQFLRSDYRGDLLYSDMVIESKYIGFFLYLLVVVAYVIALKGLADNGKHIKKHVADSLDENLKKMAMFKQYFFTVWNFALQIFFLIMAIMDEASKLLNLPLQVQKRLGRTRAFLFNTLVFPSSLLVMTIFWSLWHINRELIFPKVIDMFFPSWLNHALHTAIAVPVVVELLLPKKYSFVKFRNAVVVLVIYTTLYQLLYLSLYLRHGIWLYPIYKTMDWPQRVIFSLFQLVLAVSFQKIGIDLQNRKKNNYKTKIK